MNQLEAVALIRIYRVKLHQSLGWSVDKEPDYPTCLIYEEYYSTAKLYTEIS